MHLLVAGMCKIICYREQSHPVFSAKTWFWSEYGFQIEKLKLIRWLLKFSMKLLACLFSAWQTIMNTPKTDWTPVHRQQLSISVNLNQGKLLNCFTLVLLLRLSVFMNTVSQLLWETQSEVFESFKKGYTFIIDIANITWFQLLKYMDGDKPTQIIMEAVMNSLLSWNSSV